MIAPIYVAARGVLLDALDALGEQRQAVILAGAQAIYLHTGDAIALPLQSTRPMATSWWTRHFCKTIRDFMRQWRPVDSGWTFSPASGCVHA